MLHLHAQWFRRNRLKYGGINRTERCNLWDNPFTLIAAILHHPKTTNIQANNQTNNTQGYHGKTTSNGFKCKHLLRSVSSVKNQLMASQPSLIHREKESAFNAIVFPFRFCKCPKSL